MKLQANAALGKFRPSRLSALPDLPMPKEEDMLGDGGDTAAGAKTALRDKRCILNPRSAFMGYWDGFIFACLIFTAIFTPYEVAFTETDVCTAMFYVNRLVDISFITDMVLQFFKPFSASEKEGVWVTDLREIALFYVKGWFWIDLVSVVPYDFVGLDWNACGGEASMPSTDDSSGSGGGGDLGQQLKIIRMVRLLRLLKLARILKASRIMQAWESKLLAVNFKWLALAKFGFIIVVAGHWMACIWGLVGKFGDDPHTTWIYHNDLQDAPAEVLYFACLHWAFMTLTSIGYGDIVPHGGGEYFMSSLCMLLAGCLWAFIIGNACSVFANMDQHIQDFRSDMDSLNYFMEAMEIPEELRNRVRMFFLKARDLQRHREYIDLLDKVSAEIDDRRIDRLLKVLVDCKASRRRRRRRR